MEWLNENNLSADVLKWMEKLPSEVTTKASASYCSRERVCSRKELVSLKALDT
jgi:hypothetical protein